MAIFLIGFEGAAFPSDLEGYKLAIYGSITLDEVEALGATPVRMASTELYAAVQTGVIDGVIVNGRADRDDILQRFGGDGAFVRVEGSDVDVPTSGADDLTGTRSADSIHLLRGGDTYDGRGGNDRIWGDGGNDALHGGKGADRLWGNSGRDKLFGDGGRDKLFGGNGNDQLKGGAGNDLLDGGRGNDVMTGGRGADVFVFDTVGAKNRDTITDFRKGVDVIRLSDGDYSIGKADGNIVLRFGGGESLTLDGVGSRKNLTASIEAPDGPSEPEPSDTEPALIFDLGGKFDKSFNESAYIGAERWSNDTGGSYLELEIQSEAQREQALRRFADTVDRPIVVTGFSFADALDTVAPDYPDTPFVIVDAVVDQPNVTSYTFAEHEGAYVMGVIAAVASQTHTVGFIGGMDIPLTRRYAEAFEQGVLAQDPNAEVLVNMVGTTPAAWNDPVKGGELANAQMKQGADVIFTAAGGSGVGVLQAVADAGKLSIGTDSNQNYLHPGSVLTSMLKRVDVVVERAFRDGTDIEPGNFELGFKEGALGYARDEYNDDILTRSMMRAADAAINDIVQGAVVVEDYYDTL